jgi:hypothetical protein
MCRCDRGWSAWAAWYLRRHGSAVVSLTSLGDDELAADEEVVRRAERAVIEYDPTVWDDEKLAEVRSSPGLSRACGNECSTRLFGWQEIEDMGFEASVIQPVLAHTVALQIYGMT